MGNVELDEYYNKQDEAEGKIPMLVYSQNDEQDVILSFFNGFRGRFLDIGAYDGKTLSNTYALAELGWEGLCFEPSPRMYKQLEQTYINNPRVTIWDRAITPKDGNVTFYESDGEGVSSTVKGNVERYGCKSTEMIVKGMSIDTLFELYEPFLRELDFISLDTELTNFELLKLLPFNKLPKLTLICVETDGLFTEMSEYLSQFGFRELHRTPENIIMWR